jgi:TonB family protein
MLTALVLLAAQAASPSPGVVGVFSAMDYPRSALDRGEQGSVYFELVVDPQGRVDNCRVLISSGYKDLDDVTCRIVSTRARFAPAMSEEGKPIFGTYRRMTSWRINSYEPPPAVAPDVDLTINQAPPGAKLPLEFEVRYLVRANGTASDCRPATDSKPAPQAVPPQVLVDLACDAVTKSRIQVVRDHNNVPVEASDSATVRFSVKP